ncbi:glycerol-3-phosphate dehydrogenase [Bradyrhizobium sp. STM 3809]|uniref:glycerol-3-phosphate dehydrogenase n=1 Tax=Bradyrhizobium sp. STM 3809 TaxID=551936 RepID=UPI00024088BB|nr:glycerol-3-phosphate dehydrogenase [Bradyrhizobium sp. STM 3809]CCE00393.1 fragment of sn-glycerol-3-phosphate dehydrogenase, aerobic, FAD/NAD(P)-binding (part 2) [Bradyrhizobium sp. STM 3809]
MADYDLAIIGGGLNGVSLARDAAGRGLRVILLEQGDLGGAASSATSRLVHGDLAALERRSVLRVRRSLAERDIWLAIAPHVVRPIRFAIPAPANERPHWQLRTGLWFYDRLAARRQLPSATTLDVTHHPIGDALKRPIGTAFEYSDCVVDDSRLVALTALDAAERGAAIRTGARCIRADRDRIWRLAIIDRGHRRIVTAGALANATGAWSVSTAETVLRQPPLRVTARQVNQVVVPRLFDVDAVYVFQNSDGRLIFAQPYAGDFTLIGTVAHGFTGDPAVVTMPAADVVYLCKAANRYFRSDIQPADVVRTVAGANMMLRGSESGQLETVVSFQASRGEAPLLTMCGGDVTTVRSRAEQAMSRLARFFPMSPRWTAEAPLPGGDFDWKRFEDLVDDAGDRWRFLGEAEARRLVGAYGTRLSEILGDATSRSDLGLAFGAQLTEAEVRYLMTREWARFPEDVLWRRTKLGLTLSAVERDALAGFMARAAGVGNAVPPRDGDVNGDSAARAVELQSIGG